MDGSRFDAWVRRLAHVLPRRRALSVMAGAVSVAMSGHLTARNAAACTEDEGEPCDPTMGCCAGLGCDDGICWIIGSNQCQEIDPQTNQCVADQRQRCEGKGCKKRKGKKGKKSGKRKKGKR